MEQSSSIKTYAFLDLETTGLPHEEYNKTKITEICCIGIKSRDVASRSYPRVQQKINFCFYPERMISPESGRLTGLSNDLLEHEPRLKKCAGGVINDFLGLLEKPVCLVAHHGDHFDYPILKAEMHKAGSPLSDDLLCVDSLKAFAQLYEEDARNVARMIREPLESPPPSGVECFDEVEVLSLKRCTGAQEINETTPPYKLKKNECFDDDHDNNRRAGVDDLYYVEREKSESPTRKRLHFGRPSFKLVDLYERLTKRAPLESHRAEEDVRMLIECALTLGPRFDDWANGNALKMSAVPMMTPGKKIGT